MVTDFGIAKFRDDPDLTQAGTMVGTVKYLSPEQVRGDPVDARSDIYALGVVLFEALCSRPPFVGDSPASTALARLNQAPPRPRQLRPTIPLGLDAVITRCLQLVPEDRYASADELRAALTEPATLRGDDDLTVTVGPDRHLGLARRSSDPGSRLRLRRRCRGRDRGAPDLPRRVAPTAAGRGLHRRRGGAGRGPVEPQRAGPPPLRLGQPGGPGRHAPTPSTRTTRGRSPSPPSSASTRRGGAHRARTTASSGWPSTGTRRPAGSPRATTSARSASSPVSA